MVTRGAALVLVLAAAPLAAQGAAVGGRIGPLPADGRRWSLELRIESDVRIVEAGPEGRFLVGGLPEGTATLFVANACGEVVHVVRELELVRGTCLRDPRLEPLDWTTWSQRVRHVVDPSGLPIDGVRILRLPAGTGPPRALPAGRSHFGDAELWLPREHGVLAMLHPGFRETAVTREKLDDPVVLLPRRRITLIVERVPSLPPGIEIAVACRESLLGGAAWECLGVLDGKGRVRIVPPRSGLELLHLVPRRIGAALEVRSAVDLLVDLPHADGHQSVRLDVVLRRRLSERAREALRR